MSRNALANGEPNTLQHAVPSMRPRGGNRVRKACDRCHAARTKCDAREPCGRCSLSSLPCAYNRESQRRGRIPRDALRRNTISVDLTSGGGDGGGGGDGNVLSNAHGDARPSSETAENAGSDSNDGRPPAMDSSMTGNLPVSSIAFPDWLMESWNVASPLPDLRHFPQRFGHVDMGSQSAVHSHLPTDRPMTWSPVASMAPLGSNTASSTAPGSLDRSSNTSTLRYTVLEALVPHLQAEITAALACDLLDYYFADTAEFSCIPASPLLLGHLFRRESFTSSTDGRPCTLALLASMLLVAAATTETPFFGASPTSRSRLLNFLHKLTTGLLFHDPSATSSPSVSAQRSQGGDKSCGTKFAARHRFVDEVVTYMHLALVAMTSGIGGPATRWWHLAFQMAKEYRLNADKLSQHVGRDMHSSNLTTNTTQGMGMAESICSDEHIVTNSSVDVRDSMVIDRSDYRFVYASEEELEERRRVWWTLYIWDKQIPLSYNSPAAITDLECQEALVPIDDKLWQKGSYVSGPGTMLDTVAIDAFGRARMTSPTKQSEIFIFLLPFGRTLEALIENHRKSLRCSLDLGALSHYSPNGFVHQLLLNLMQQVDDSHHAASNAWSCEQPFSAYRRFLVSVLCMLETAPWDMLSAQEVLSAGHANLDELHNRIVHSVIATANALQEVLREDPDFGSFPVFYNVFLFLGSAITATIISSLGARCSDQLLLSGETFVRALESIISTEQMEHQRKVRRMLLMALSFARRPRAQSTAELTILQHIARTYRWSIGGAGLGM